MPHSISERAMLVQLSIRGFWGWVVEDEEASQVVAAKYGANPEIGRYMKKLLDPRKIRELRDLNSARSALYNFHKETTLPWADKGIRVLPAAAYFDYTSGIAERTNKVMAAYDAFSKLLPALQAQAQCEQNGLFRAGDWPDPKDMMERVKIRSRIFPLAEADDFRVSLGQEQEALIRKEIEANIHATLNRAMVEVYGRLRTCVEDMAERIAAYEVDDKGKTLHTFRDTAITNLRELVELVPKLNVTGDPTLDQMAKAIRDLLCKRDPQELRDNHIVRQQHVQAARAVAEQLAKVEQILGGGE